MNIDLDRAALAYAVFGPPATIAAGLVRALVITLLAVWVAAIVATDDDPDGPILKESDR